LVGKITDAGAQASLKDIRLIAELDGKTYIKDWLQLKEADSVYRKQKKSLYEILELMQLKQLACIPVNTDTLLLQKKQTLFGGIYWGDESYRFWDNSIQTTLLAYKILKAKGGQEAMLERIRQYFLEQRRGGQWRNTYESSLILETILPDLLVAGVKSKPASVTIDGAVISQFPFEKQLNAGEIVTLKKEGSMPLYFTAYQQYQNHQPQKISKDFTVDSRFLQEGYEVKELKAGKKVTLQVVITARADAEYVMVEIPIPAGCSYENKIQNYWGVEVHREYFKNKTVIFCSRLKQGTYTFNIDLMPRYTGKYVLNPAKAEMMYFPVFYGREGMKKMKIK
ncbi:MAG TPA: hypothetical protein VF421_01485, partial [Niabella sp.]